MDAIILLNTFMYYKYFLPVSGLSFYSINSVFRIANIFNFDELLLINLFFYGLCFWCDI